MTKQASANKEANTANDSKASNVTDLVSVSKIERAKKFFETISAASYEPKEGSSARKDFIDQCITDLGMTEAGASTYWQNLRNESKTGNLYPHAKAPTGAPRGRRIDVGGRVKKAAAKVQKKRLDVEEAMKALASAENDLVEITTGALEAQAS